MKIDAIYHYGRLINRWVTECSEFNFWEVDLPKKKKKEESNYQKLRKNLGIFSKLSFLLRTRQHNSRIYTVFFLLLSIFYFWILHWLVDKFVANMLHFVRTGVCKSQLHYFILNSFCFQFTDVIPQYLKCSPLFAVSILFMLKLHWRLLETFTKTILSYKFYHSHGTFWGWFYFDYNVLRWSKYCNRLTSSAKEWNMLYKGRRGVIEITSSDWSLCPTRMLM